MFDAERGRGGDARRRRRKEWRMPIHTIRAVDYTGMEREGRQGRVEGLKVKEVDGDGWSSHGTHHASGDQGAHLMTSEHSINQISVVSCEHAVLSFSVPIVNRAEQKYAAIHR